MKKFSAIMLAAGVASYALTIKDVKYEGLSRISPMMAEELSGVRKGDQFSYDRIGKSILNFYSQGYFEDIWVDEQDGTLTYRFKEKPIVAKIEFAGESEGDVEKYMSNLGVKKGDSFDEDKVEKSKKAIIKHIESEGYFNTVIETDKKELNDGQALALTYVINKGEKIYIDKLNAVGIKKIKKRKALSQAANQEREWMGWLWGRNDGKLKLDELSMDGARIKDVYMQNGFLDATVSEPFLSADFNTYTATLDYKISEGEAYKISDVKIEQKEQVVDEKELLAELKLKKGAIFNVEKLRKDMELIKYKVSDKGYAFTRVTPDFIKDEKTHTTSIVFMVEPGQKVFINNVIIAGNDRTLDSVVRRDMYLAPGDLYSLTDMTDSKNALKRTGFFEDVTVDEKRVSVEKMDIIVKVKEAPTGNVLVGGGYGSYDGLIFNAGINDKNIFGSGLNLGFNVELSGKQSNFDISLFNPHLRDGKYSLGGNIFSRKYISYDYTEETKGASVTTGKQLTRYLSGGASYQYNTIQYSELSANIVRPQDLENTTKSSITPFLSYDNTDDYYTPRKGISASTSLEYAGVGGKEKYVKSFSKFGYYYGFEDLIDYDAILRYKARLGWIFNDEQIARGSKLYMGGLSSVRGYQSSSIGTKDSQDYLLGDTKTFSNSVELSLPLITEAKMRFSFFFDYGMIGSSSITENTRMGTGVALEWFSPMGPIQIIYAKPLNQKTGDKTSNIEFTIGTRF
ncbi:MAG TPA: outer membrane protein assembly factor BamA [Campylobacterales bacterium]|nr:outer membrane protein assembly factor BamA [Campylobacterales bacterium]